MLLQEVPGAMERPSGCKIEVTQEPDSTEIRLPPRKSSWLDRIPALLLLIALSILFYSGIEFFFHKRLVIGPNMNIERGGHISYNLQRYMYWLAPVWIALEALGVFTLSLVMRPFLTTETLRIDRLGVTITHAMPFSCRQSILLKENLRGFRLRRDPQGMWGSHLQLQSVGQDIEVGEYTNEVEREWLASVGNALLGRY